MKKITLISLLFLFTYHSWAGIIGPDALPTITALIKLHKQMAKAEELSVHQVSASYLEQGVATENTTKFHEVRKTLNSKLKNAHQWIILAAAMSKTTLDVGNATKEYIQFTKLMSNNLFRKPQIAWYFVETNYNLAKRISLLRKSIALLAASETNILKASSDERIEVIYNIQEQIAVIRSLISQALFWSKCVSLGGFRYDYIWDILNSDVYDGIAKDIINNWTSNIS